MSSPKPKGPTPLVAKGIGTPFARTLDLPATSGVPDPYAPNDAGVSKRQGQDVNTRKTRAQFRQIEFQRAILQHGYYLTWSKAVVCPCMNPETEQTRVNCSTCDGSGFYYVEPLTIRAIMSSLERNAKVFEKFGGWVEGTSQMTTEPQYRLGYRDRVEMQDTVMTHNELFQKGDRRGTRSKLPARMDSVRYRIARVVKLVVSVGSVNRECCTEGAVPAGVDIEDDDAIIPLEEGYHFKVSADGWIEWLTRGEDLVPDGAWLSVLYEYAPVYVVISHPHATRMETIESKAPTQQPFALPVQAFVKLDYLSDINAPLPSMTTTKAA